MGLDMYVYRTKEDIAKTGHERPADTGIPSSGYLVNGKFDYDKYEKLKKKVQVFYWRKHPGIHGWFQELWSKSGGTGEDTGPGSFNGGDWVRIDSNDLDALEKIVKSEDLPNTRGFFFGSDYGDADEKKNDLKFIAKARKEIAKGYKLFYTSSW